MLYNVVFGIIFSYSRSTRRKCNWTSKVFEDWLADRKKVNHDPVFTALPDDLLHLSDDQLVYVLTRFILEVKKKSTEDYPAETLYEIVISLQLFMFINGRRVKLLDDDKFIDVRNCTCS